jgi:hypothetical protein
MYSVAEQNVATNELLVAFCSCRRHSTRVRKKQDSDWGRKGEQDQD